MSGFTDWRYDGNDAEMTIYARSGKELVRLPLSIPNAHALMAAIKEIKADARRCTREELFAVLDAEREKP